MSLDVAFCAGALSCGPLVIMPMHMLSALFSLVTLCADMHTSYVGTVAGSSELYGVGKARAKPKPVDLTV